MVFHSAKKNSREIKKFPDPGKKIPAKKNFFPPIREKFKNFFLNHKSYEEFYMGINNKETDNFITRIVHLFRKIRKVIKKI